MTITRCDGCGKESSPIRPLRFRHLVENDFLLSEFKLKDVCHICQEKFSIAIAAIIRTERGQ